MTQGVKANTCSDPAKSFITREASDPVSGANIRVWASGNDVCAQINREAQAGIPFVVNGPAPILRTTTSSTTSTSTTLEITTTPETTALTTTISENSTTSAIGNTSTTPATTASTTTNASATTTASDNTTSTAVVPIFTENKRSAPVDSGIGYLNSAVVSTLVIVAKLGQID